MSSEFFSVFVFVHVSAGATETETEDLLEEDLLVLAVDFLDDVFCFEEAALEALLFSLQPTNNKPAITPKIGKIDFFIIIPF